MARSSIVGVVLLFALTGCKRTSEVDCGAAAKAWVELAQHQLDADGDPDRTAKAHAVLPAMREALVARCKDDRWSLESRRCVAEARDLASLERCEPAPPAP